MSPPYINGTATTGVAVYMPAATGLQRNDSPIEGFLFSNAEQLLTEEEPNLSTDTSLAMAGDPRQRSAPANFTFVTFNNPNELKDKGRMRGVRQQVMHNYLNKERKNPNSTDPRANGSTQGRKRQRPDTQSPTTSTNTNAPSIIFASDQDRHSSVSSTNSGASDRVRPRIPSETSTTNWTAVASLGLPAEAVATETQQPTSTEVSRHCRRRIATPDHGSPLVQDVGTVPRNQSYWKTCDSAPLPIRTAVIPTRANALVTIGRELEAVGVLPSLSKGVSNVQKLKFNCSQRFYSKALQSNWLPMLLETPEAFYSTICIVQAHDEVMQRGARAPQERFRHEFAERIAVRNEVHALVNQAVGNPTTRLADTTIAAVLQLLNAEIVGCDKDLMDMHQQALHAMVAQRGGLQNLGLSGQLAAMMTITTYLISGLRETIPHPDFVQYANTIRAKPPNDSRQIPESPVYCRPQGFETIHRSLSHTSPTFGLLENLRLLTDAYVRRPRSAPVSPFSPASTSDAWNQSLDQVPVFRDRIFAARPAAEHLDDFRHMHDKYAFEALRLTGHVYAYALAHEVPFSKAAAALSASTRTPFHVLIKAALSRTSFTDCWGHLAGVLFWISIVAGAAANIPTAAAPAASLLPPDVQLEAEDSRKWLAAISVRCSIVLSFEYGGAMLETLRRLVGIEAALMRADRQAQAQAWTWQAEEDFVPFEQQQQTDREYSPPAVSTDWQPVGPTATTGGPALASCTTTYGPPVPFGVELGFLDFAADFDQC